MDSIIDVNTGELAVCSGPYKLRAMALGSCIAVMGYDAAVGLGGMVHIMLPGKSPQICENRTKYASCGIGKLISEMVDAGADFSRIEVCLVGGGNVLQKPDDTICENNIASVTSVLQAKHLPVRASVLGGTTRKSATLDIKSGRVFYTEGDSHAILLWQPAACSFCMSSLSFSNTGIVLKNVNNELSGEANAVGL